MPTFLHAITRYIRIFWAYRLLSRGQMPPKLGQKTLQLFGSFLTRRPCLAYPSLALPEGSWLEDGNWRVLVNPQIQWTSLTELQTGTSRKGSFYNRRERFSIIQAWVTRLCLNTRQWPVEPIGYLGWYGRRCNHMNSTTGSCMPPFDSFNASSFEISTPKFLSSHLIPQK